MVVALAAAVQASTILSCDPGAWRQPSIWRPEFISAPEGIFNATRLFQKVSDIFVCSKAFFLK
jgi:hypothetical protein